MEILSSYNLIIEVSLIIIISFIFNGISKKTNIPSVLLLIILGVCLQYALGYFTTEKLNFLPILEVFSLESCNNFK